MSNQVVHITRSSVFFPTYAPCPPDPHPMFLEKRVYQGSQGKVYPLPFYSGIAAEPTERAWQAIDLENEFVKLMLLPEIGGRIHIGQDKTNGYDFFYRQNVIKPALVGLAGPWISGGVEFNWPQHHRPATYMPVEVHIEDHADGSRTVWMGDHDPMSRMKGMHGVCLHPGKAVIELKVRAYNRTPFVQTFLWWANVAARVHEGYQSFFPPDVTHVADHAKRAVSSYPLSQGFYYGIDYAARGRNGIPSHEVPAQFTPPHAGGRAKGLPKYAPNDLSWYGNIPVPTSYMCVGSEGNFFGGYDHFEQAGFVHVANRHISPGKKQWTWGNDAFGHVWNENLTERDGPYIELMAGVYTDNQPDFAFLQPGETKTWSQFWYPIQKIGPAQEANVDAAVSLRVQKGEARLGVAATSRFPGATVELRAGGRVVGTWKADLSPSEPFLHTAALPARTRADQLQLTVASAEGRLLIAYRPGRPKPPNPPVAATEPPAPKAVASVDELYLTGLHLEQYRHATRSPVPYWEEGLRRDAGDARCHNALGLWHLRRGEFTLAEEHFHQAIARLTARNPNPYDGEPYYNLGLALRYLDRDEEAYAAFYKATWNQAWQSTAFHALAEIDCRRGDWATALDHLDRSLRLNTDHLRARNLRVLVLRKLGREAEAAESLRATRALDPLDGWARHLAGEALACDTQSRLDLVLDLARAGFLTEAIPLLETATPEPYSGTAPLVAYYLGWLHALRGDPRALDYFRAAARHTVDYCFPARLEEIAILEAAITANPRDAHAPYLLGNLLYDKRRHTEAIARWEASAKIDPNYSIVWRNLGIGYFNVYRQPERAQIAFDKAFAADPGDAQLLYERDQLWKHLGLPPAQRLRELARHRAMVEQRDDLTVELCALYNLAGKPALAREIVSARKFQPWEGGEGRALGQHVRTHLALGRAAMEKKDFAGALAFFEAALATPPNLSEARHLLANQSDLHYELGRAYAALGQTAKAKAHWTAAAEFKGDFQGMSVRSFSEMTYFSAAALAALGRKPEARQLFQRLLTYALKLEKEPATIDYFATSLPTMLLFEEDLAAQQRITAQFLQAQACAGLGKRAQALRLLATVLRRDPAHALAAELRAILTAKNKK
jgi:tetratricopeptide (TPR) repeat protein